MTSRWWHPLVDTRFLIALVVLALFAWALGDNPDDDTMKGALIGALNLAVGYFLGSSRGAAAASETANKAIDLAAQNSPSPDTPQAVVVANEQDDPVPVEPKP